MTNIWKAAELGQSIWCDYISRELLSSGGLDEMMEKGVRGVTSNPAIFNKAISKGDGYDDAIKAMAKSGMSDLDIYEGLALEDISDAADRMIPVFEATGGTDGYVSLEVDPRMADDEERTVSEALRLRSLLGRPNVMIKIPATEAGISALERATDAGVSVNATLIFSVAQTEAVGRAYIRGLKARLDRGDDVSSVRSVASLFVSRVDSAVDPLLQERAPELMGKIAVDNARLAYNRWGEIFSGADWKLLAKAGGCPQRMLWASTGTKNRSYRDTLYVEELIGPDTVNTVPPATMDAFLDHGLVENRVACDLDDAFLRRQSLVDLGVDLDRICDGLREDGVNAFVTAFDELLKAVGEKASSFR
ncbi:MAG: transaldolase [Synergistota bacterium]|nr:transaldolase [Synergistota bacterium]